MAIYKSSFNKKPEKEKKEKPVKPKKEKEIKEKRKVKVNAPLVSLIVFAAIFLVCLPPNFLRSFILGVVGLSVYPICFIGITFSLLFLSKKVIKVKKRYLVYLLLALTMIWFILHLILTGWLDKTNYGIFLAATYKAKTTAGGLLFSLISYPIEKAITLVGAYILSFILLAIFVGLIIDYIIVDKNIGHKEKSKFDFKSIENFEDDTSAPKLSDEDKQKQIAKRRLGLEKGETTIISSDMPKVDLNPTPAKPMSKREYILTPLEPVIPPENDVFMDNKPKYEPKDEPAQIKLRPWQVNGQNNLSQNTPIEPEPVKEIEEIEPKEVYPSEPEKVPDDEVPNEENLDSYNETYDESEPEDDIFEDNSEDYSELESEVSEYEDLLDLNDNETSVEPSAESEPNVAESEIAPQETQESTAAQEITPNIKVEEYVDEYGYAQNESLGSTVETEVVRPSVDISKFHLPNQVKKPVAEQVKIDDIKPKEEIPPYVAPPVELLDFIEHSSPISEEALQDNIVRLEQVLEDFKVPAKVNNVQVGPAVTRYELTMPRGISVNKIAQMADDIAMTLASNGAIRVEAPIPGKNAVGIEVPNDSISPVSLRELVDSDEFRVRGNPLSFVLGKDINGDIIFCNLDKMPHLLVAGSTGSGKSVCLNTMLLSMCYKAGPQDLRLILVDPKMVEFTTYNGLPHLLIPEVITGKEMTINALDWAIKEMERRYALFAKNHVVNINEFNKSDAVKFKREEKLPFIVIVVDELADLMLEAKREIEDRIAKLAAKARAAGIHLVLATQRPSVDVITGTVKANLPSRVAFALTNFMDSKTVLDGGGAEKLLGKGDMLFKPQDKPEPRRVQGAYVSNPEIAKVVEFIKEHNKPVYDEATGKAIKNPYQDKSGGNSEGGLDSQEFDPLIKDVLFMFIQNKQASGSMISRRYSVGFNRAGRMMDQMERAGFIGPQEGSKPRQVLITMEEYNAIFGDKN